MTMINIQRPMMSEKEIAIIDKILSDRKPIFCLEWGSGGSTVYFPKTHSCIRQWVSVEHDGRYAEKVQKEMDKKVILYQVKLQEYLSIVQNMRFDFILIDGLMRAECLMFARELLNEEGIILLHDSSRAEYQKYINNWQGKTEKLADGEIETKTFAHRGLYKFWK